MLNALKRAIKAAKSQQILAQRIGATQQQISYWVTQSKRVPAEYVLPIERETGISRHDLRPDLYPRSEEAAA